MAASSPKACCTIGVKHEGVASGQIKKIGQGTFYPFMRLQQMVEWTDDL